jgi:hypothetical protein
MKLHDLTACLALALAAGTDAGAAVTAQQAEHLGKDLTAIGAERAASADGGVPAWEGGEAPLPGWSWGKVRWQYSRYKDEKPLFSIDASNVDAHAAHLTDAQVLALKSVPGYRMDVYPSHRACNIDPVYAGRSLRNATEAKIGADGWTLQHALTAGVPFPIPQSGVEAMYNSRMRDQGIGYRVDGATTMISPNPSSSEFTSYVWNLVNYLPSQRPERSAVEDDGGVEFYLHYTYSEPAALKGQALIALSFSNKPPEQYYYFPGQRRVRRLPNSVFDTPVVGYENQYLNDEQFLLWSTLDRFDYKLVGKQEIYIAYNALRMYDFEAKVADVYGKSFVNPTTGATSCTGSGSSMPSSGPAPSTSCPIASTTWTRTAGPSPRSPSSTKRAARGS